jgi:parallel beta-helix repeat protein
MHGKMKYLIALLLLLLMASGQARTLTVDPSGSGDAKTLSSAISMASPGDAIYIRPGNYGGAIVDRSVTISGTDQANLSGSLVISAPGCKISDLVVRVSGNDPAIVILSWDNLLMRCTVAGASTGIRIMGENNTVRECRIDSALGLEFFGAKNGILNSSFLGDVGIKMNSTSENTVKGCQIVTKQGVLVESSMKNRIEKNNLSGSGFGMVLTGSSGNEILDNNLSGAYVSGVDVVDSTGNNLTGNHMTGGKLGISLRRASENNLTENVCWKIERAGIYGDSAFGNYLANNSLSENGNGILLSGSTKNLLSSNNASRNTYGISLRGSIDNVLRDNTLKANAYNLRTDAGDASGAFLTASSHDFFIQDIDDSNLADGKPICYLVGKANLAVPSGCGFLGIISCRNIEAANMTISNSSAGVLVVNSTSCRIENSSFSFAERGIFLLDCANLIVESCRAVDCQTGFEAMGSSHGRFVNNFASNCSEEGFSANSALDLSWSECRAEACARGLDILRSRLCTVDSCRVNHNEEAGIALTSSHKCGLGGNEAFSNGRGIALVGSNGCVLKDNNVRMNQRDGLSLEQLADADVENNTAQGNAQGIFVQSSKRVAIEENNMTENSHYGLRMSSASGCNVTENSFLKNQIAGANLVDCTTNFLYHNIFMDNGIQNAADNGDNQWDAGPKEGGNYWSDHRVTGNPGNEPRQIPAKGVDRYPFQDPGGWR